MKNHNTRHTIIIAEAGVNHNGNLDTAFEMVHKAHEAGADYVKFQTFRARNLVCASARRAAYQERNCGGTETQFQMLKRLELDFSAFAALKDECDRTGIGFLSSAFDLESIDLLRPLGMDYWKIPSGEITNLPYLEAIAATGGKVILSTGMCLMSEIEDAVCVLERGGIQRKDISLLHCNTQYPTPAHDVNLLAMRQLRETGCGMTGFSDHTRGIAAPIAAVALGAQIIEKHFTLDRDMPGPDHKASADVAEFTHMVDGIRFVEQALGSPSKQVTDSERQNVDIARKSIVASRRIGKGELLTAENLTTKRPGTGISPMRWHEVTGLYAQRPFEPDEQITI